MHLLVLFIVLLSIIYQDFKDRAVYLFWYPVLLLVISYQYYLMPTVPYALLLANLLFVFILVGGVFLFYRFKNHTIHSFFEKVFGLGDLLFFVFMALFFAPANFLIVFNISLILCLILALAIKSFKTRGVPLAGIQAFVVLLWCIGSEIDMLPSNFDDYWVLSI